MSTKGKFYNILIKNSNYKYFKVPLIRVVRIHVANNMFFFSFTLLSPIILKDIFKLDYKMLFLKKMLGINYLDECARNLEY